MAYSQHLWGLYAKKEVTYQTDVAPTAANAVMTMEPLWSKIVLDYHWPNERLLDANSSLMPRASAAPRGRKAALEIAWRARGFGAAYSGSNLPEADPLFQACAMSQTVVTTGGSESVTYAPADSSHASATIWAYAANKLYKVVGCRGTWSWAIPTGELAVIRFKMNGVILADPTETALATQTYQATVPPAAVGLALNIGAYAPDLVTGQFDLGAVIQQLLSGNAADGISEYDASHFIPTQQLTVRQAALGTYDPMADFKSATGRNIVYTVGGTQYNKIGATLNLATHRRMPRHAVDQEFTAWDLEFLCPSVSIVFN